MTDQFDLLKSHIDAYTRKDGAVVNAHDDKRTKKVDLRAVAEKHDDKFMSKDTEWSRDTKKIPAGDIPDGAPEFSHQQVYGNAGKTSPAGSDFDKDFAENAPQHFVLKHKDGGRHLVNTEGYGYARYHAPIDDSAAAEEKTVTHKEGDSVKVTGKVNGQGKTGVIQETAPSGHFHIVKHSDGSKASYHESDLSPHDEDDEDEDRDEDDEDHEVLKSHIEAYTRKDGAVVQAHDDQRVPKPGDVGHEEHQKYGAYFRRGDKVKDNFGKEHEVMEHVGSSVKTYSGKDFHPTKLHRI
jgi:hypothetical protein